MCRALLSELNPSVTQPERLQLDNEAVTRMMTEERSSQASKHVDIKFHDVRDW